MSSSSAVWRARSRPTSLPIDLEYRVARQKQSMPSDNINIFIDSKMSVEDLAESFEKMLGIKLEHNQTGILGLNRKYYFYVFADPVQKVWFSICKSNFFLNAGNMEFERYKHRIEIGCYAGNEAGKEKIAYAFADTIFLALKKTRHYPLMMVNGVENKLAEFDPYAKSSDDSDIDNPG